MARRRVNVFSLSFLDAMTCGFGAVVLFYMVINASIGMRAGDMTASLQGEVNLLEDQVLDKYKDLVEIRNTLREIEEKMVNAQGLSTRVLRDLEETQEELATYAESTLSREEHINRLKADLKSLEEEAKRLAERSPAEDGSGDRLRERIGDGNRQYLTGLKVGGKRIFILVDASASMLGDTIVNIIRRRNLPDAVKIHADKWQQTLETVDWLTTQIPADSKFQIYTFNDRAGPVIPGTDGQWLKAADPGVLDDAVQRLRAIVPRNGTGLYSGFDAVNRMSQPPDNLILLVDGLPTLGDTPPRGATISGKQRAKLFERAIKHLEGRMPVNVILFPMEGDPLAATGYWKLAIRSGGSFMSPSADWP